MSKKTAQRQSSSHHMHERNCGFASNQMQERTQPNAVYNASGVEHVYLYTCTTLAVGSSKETKMSINGQQPAPSR
jgi:hypothetical protein